MTFLSNTKLSVVRLLELYDWQYRNLLFRYLGLVWVQSCGFSFTFSLVGKSLQCLWIPMVKSYLQSTVKFNRLTWKMWLVSFNMSIWNSCMRSVLCGSFFSCNVNWHLSVVCNKWFYINPQSFPPVATHLLVN